MEVSKIKGGLIDPKALGFRDHDARSLADHLTDFRAYLIGKECTQVHADLTHNRVARLIDLARTRRVSDLALSRIQAALKTIRDGGLSLPSGRSITMSGRSSRSRSGCGEMANAT